MPPLSWLVAISPSSPISVLRQYGSLFNVMGRSKLDLSTKLSTILWRDMGLSKAEQDEQASLLLRLSKCTFCGLNGHLRDNCVAERHTVRQPVQFGTDVQEGTKVKFYSPILQQVGCGSSFGGPDSIQNLCILIAGYHLY